MQEINELVENVIKNAKSFAEVAQIVGKPIVNGDGTVIFPVSKVSCGFVVGNARIISTKKQKEQITVDGEGNGTPIGTSGGGITITPLGFLICGRDKRFVSVENGGENKWAKLFDDVIACLKKDN